MYASFLACRMRFKRGAQWQSRVWQNSNRGSTSRRWSGLAGAQCGNRRRHSGNARQTSGPPDSSAAAARIRLPCDDILKSGSRNRENNLTMENLKPVDVAIVGGGWTGLMMAKEITTRTALSVAVLERGVPRKTVRLRAGHGRARLRRPPAHDAEHRRRDHHAPALDARLGRARAPIRIVSSRLGRGRRGRTLERRCPCAFFRACSPCGLT